MVGAAIHAHANGVIMTSPDEALVIAGSLVAVGAGLTLRHCIRKLGMREKDFGEAGNLEIDLLDENQPDQVFYDTAYGIYSGLIAAKMTKGTVKPRLRWLRGLWSVDHGTNVGGSEFDEPVSLVDLTTLTTPILNEKTGQLVY
jgi:hypothetical protein